MDTAVRTRRVDETFRALFQLAPAGVALCDLAGRILDLNTAARDLLDGTGIDLDDATLHDLLRFTPAEADEHERWPDELAAVAAGRRPVARVQVSLAPPGAAPRMVRATAAPVVLADRPSLLVHIEDATGRRMAEQRLVQLATHDALTGLANRELVQQRLVAALTRASVSTLPVGVLHLDLDQFTAVNERYGRTVGDAVLAAVGERLGAVLRAGDSAGRLTSDEFLVVAGDVAGEQALAELVRRIDDTLSEPLLVGDPAAPGPTPLVVPLTVSIGSVLSRPGEQAGPLLRRADAALYAARRARRRQLARARRQGVPHPPAPRPDRSGSVEVPAQGRTRQLACEQAAVAEQR